MLLAVLEAAQQGLDSRGLIAARFIVDSQAKAGHFNDYEPVPISINGAEKVPRHRMENFRAAARSRAIPATHPLDFSGLTMARRMPYSL